MALPDLKGTIGEDQREIIKEALRLTSQEGWDRAKYIGASTKMLLKIGKISHQVTNRAESGVFMAEAFEAICIYFYHEALDKKANHVHKSTDFWLEFVVQCLTPRDTVGAIIESGPPSPN